MDKPIRTLLGMIQYHPQRQPPPKTAEEWRAHWQSQGQLWRTEPEIGGKRQKVLSQHCAIVADIEQRSYPFRGMKLSRADVEWLLATHESGRGPVDWSDENQRGREGLDLRGADLCNVDLSDLPLARLQGGLTMKKLLGMTKEQRNYAALLIDRANSLTLFQELGYSLYGMEPEERFFGGAHLEEAYFLRVFLEKLSLAGAQMQGVNLNRAHLEGAEFSGVQLQNANLREAQLQNADLRGTQLQGARLTMAHLEGTDLSLAHLEGAYLPKAHLERAYLIEAHLDEADLRGAHLQGADLRWAHLQGADLRWAHLQKALLNEAHLESANLANVMLSDEKRIGPQVADTQWDSTNLTVVK